MREQSSPKVQIALEVGKGKSAWEYKWEHFQPSFRSHDLVTVSTKLSKLGVSWKIYNFGQPYYGS